MTPPPDLVGYEILIEEIIRRENLVSIPGDFLEIGAFRGGGTVKLANYLKEAGSSKAIWAVEQFDVHADTSTTNWGLSMADIYRAGVPGDGGWREALLETYSPFPNIRLFEGDSMAVNLPESPLAFAFIDGCHMFDHVVHDFEEAWRRISPGGVLALHDYGNDLPEVTRAFRTCLALHEDEIDFVGRVRWNPLVWIRRKSAVERKIPRIAVLFCHHAQDELTAHHWDLLKRANAGDTFLDLIPIGFENPNLLKDSFAVRQDDNLPSNRAPHLRGNWSEIDLLMYQFALSGRAGGYDHIIFLESDCEVTVAVRELFRSVLPFRGAGGIVRRGSRECMDWVTWNEVSEWQREQIGNNAAGVTPINGLIVSAPLLIKISGLIRNSPRLFDDMSCEARIATAARMVGDDLGSIIWMEGVNDWNEGLVVDNGRGFLHPVKRPRNLKPE